jgi:hypothetical protein
MDISSKKPKDAKFVLHKIWCTLEKIFLGKGVYWKKVKDQLKLIQLIFIISE